MVDEPLHKITSNAPNDMDLKIEVATNAIAWEVFAHRRSEEGATEMWLDDEEVARCRRAAERVVDHLMEVGVIF